jgi:hypothetical protein
MAKFIKAIKYFAKELVEYNRDPKAWVQAWEARHPEPVAEECDSFCFCLDCQRKWDEQVSDECLYYREPGVQCKCLRCYY